MPNQLKLAFTVNVAGTSYGPTKAAAALAAVPLYANPTNDPVLGQFFGLTIAQAVVGDALITQDITAEPVQAIHGASNTSPIVLVVASTAGFANNDSVTVVGVTGNTAANGTFTIAGVTPTGFQLVGSTGNGTYVSGGTVTDNSSVTRTLTLNMTKTFSPTAPPPFPCSPITAVPPVPPYAFLTTQALSGNFLTTPGSAVVGTSLIQGPSIVPGNTIQFLSQPGVFYTVLTVPAAPAHGITLSTPYTGPFSADLTAVLMVPAPAKIVAVYSTSPQDSIAVGTLPAGNGALTLQFTYLDSTGAGPFTASVNLKGKYPSLVTLPGGINVASVSAMQLFSTGPFGNNVGQITLCELSAAPPAIPVASDAQQVQALTDQAQALITRGLVYLPPSFFALAQQGLSTPSLKGEFQLPGRLTTRAAGNATAPGGVSIGTTVNQSIGPALAPTNVIEFAAQPGVPYTIAAVGTGNITLTTAYTGLNDNPILSSASLITPSPAVPPTNAQIATDLGEFVNPGTAVPPPSLPLAPQTMTPSPVFLSGMFARTLQLALAVPVVPSAIVLS